MIRAESHHPGFTTQPYQDGPPVNDTDAATRALALYLKPNDVTLLLFNSLLSVLQMQKVLDSCGLGIQE